MRIGVFHRFLLTPMRLLNMGPNSVVLVASRTVAWNTNLSLLEPATEFGLPNILGILISDWRTLMK